jgi:2-oxoglutarate ferredoxin oxidoreductase subunit beta
MEGGKEYTGIIYQNPDSVAYGEREGLDQNMSEIPDGAPDGATNLVREFY